MVKDNEDLKFPHHIYENGECEMLDDNNKCKVYENRPLVCNIDKMADYLGKSKEDFYKLNVKACNKMIKEEGLDDEYLIKE